MIQINLAPGAQARRSTARRRASLSLPALPSFGADPRGVLAGALAVLVVLVVTFSVWRVNQRRDLLAAEIASAVQDSTRFATTI